MSFMFNVPSCLAQIMSQRSTHNTHNNFRFGCEEYAHIYNFYRVGHVMLPCYRDRSRKVADIPLYREHRNEPTV